ncbi:MAG: bacterioferritin [Terriglobia bacterium]
MSQKLIHALNEDIALELGAIIQYMWHHIMATGTQSPEVEKIFRQIALEEMRHAEMFAERLSYLGGTPTVDHSEIKVGGDINKMMEDDLAGEKTAIKKYKQDMKLADAEDDPATRRLLEDIIIDEERHDDIWSSILDR